MQLQLKTVDDPLVVANASELAFHIDVYRTGSVSETGEGFTRQTLTGVAVVMAITTVVKRIPLIRFPARMKSPATPPAASAPSSSPSSSSALGAESKTPPTTGADVAASSRPHHSSQKPPV